MFWHSVQLEGLTSYYRGERSLPSCLGGGDLDGDDYNLILDVGFAMLFFFVANSTVIARLTSP